jgi:GTP cyclohydrolase I
MMEEANKFLEHRDQIAGIAPPTERNLDSERVVKVDDGSLKFKKNQVAGGVRQILLGLGVDLESDDFKDTPSRVARAFQELCSGLYVNEKKVEDVFGKKFPSPYKGMIVVGPVTVAGVCPHHLLPVSMTAVLAYISDPKTQDKLGLSKVVRGIRLFAQRPAMQETISNDIVEAFNKYVKPAGVALWIKGSHNCMTSRGVLQPQSQAITQDVRGLFETDVGVKTEFEHKLMNLGVDRA